MSGAVVGDVEAGIAVGCADERQTGSFCSADMFGGDAEAARCSKGHFGQSGCILALTASRFY